MSRMVPSMSNSAARTRRGAMAAHATARLCAARARGDDVATCRAKQREPAAPHARGGAAVAAADMHGAGAGAFWRPQISGGPASSAGARPKAAALVRVARLGTRKSRSP